MTGTSNKKTVARRFVSCTAGAKLLTLFVPTAARMMGSPAWAFFPKDSHGAVVSSRPETAPII
jgi:hypothetical protein